MSQTWLDALESVALQAVVDRFDYLTEAINARDLLLVILLARKLLEESQ